MKITAAGVPADMVSVIDTAFDELSVLTERVAASCERLVRAGIIPLTVRYGRYHNHAGGTE